MTEAGIEPSICPANLPKPRGSPYPLSLCPSICSTEHSFGFNLLERLNTHKKNKFLSTRGAKTKQKVHRQGAIDRACHELQGQHQATSTKEQEEQTSECACP